MANKAETVRNNLTVKINRSNLVHDTSHLSFIIKTTGFLFWKKNTLHISGRVGLQSEKNAIDEIINEFSANIEIISTIRVKQNY